MEVGRCHRQTLEMECIELKQVVSHRGGVKETGWCKERRLPDYPECPSWPVTAVHLGLPWTSLCLADLVDWFVELCCLELALSSQVYLLLCVLPRVVNTLILFVCVCTYTYMSHRSVMSLLDHLELEVKAGVNCLTWVLITKLGSFGKTVSFLTTKSSLQPKKCGQSCLEFKHFYYLSVWMSMRWYMCVNQKIECGNYIWFSPSTMRHRDQT